MTEPRVRVAGDRSDRACRSHSCLVGLVLSSILIGCGGGSDSRSSAPLPQPTHPEFERLDATSLSTLGLVPFDVDREDLAGPDSHDAQYGKLPEIVAVPGTGFLDVVLRSTDESAGPRAFQVRITDSGGGWSVSEALEVPSLGLVLGFTRADDGAFHYATATTDEDVGPEYPQVSAHRSNVVRVYRYDGTGDVTVDVDLDIARADADGEAEPLVNPGVASTARLAVAGNVLTLVAGNNTAPDPQLNGTRHQKAASTYLDATTGAIVATSGIWMSHSFDQRYFVDGTDVLEIHLGDTYERAINYSRITGGDASDAITAFKPKGAGGNNNTFTRLGNMARVPSASGSALLLLLSTEHGDVADSRVNSSRDLAIARIVDDALDTSFGAAVSVTSAGDAVTNHLLFLTNYDATSAGTLHAERPKLVPVGPNELIVLWEQWSYAVSTDDQAFEGTYAMRIDGAGAVLSSATRVSDHHLPRGDDAFAYAGAAAWLTGNHDTRELMLHVVSPALTITETIVP